MCLIQLIKIKHLIGDLSVYKQLSEVLFLFFLSLLKGLNKLKILSISAVQRRNYS